MLVTLYLGEHHDRPVLAVRNLHGGVVKTLQTTFRLAEATSHKDFVLDFSTPRAFNALMHPEDWAGFAFSCPRQREPRSPRRPQHERDGWACSRLRFAGDFEAMSLVERDGAWIRGLEIRRQMVSSTIRRQCSINSRPRPRPCSDGSTPSHGRYQCGKRGWASSI